MNQPYYDYGNSPRPGGNKQLVRNTHDKWLGGVCSGVGQYFNIDPNIIRVVFAAATLFGGASIVVYLILWVIMPAQ